MNPIMTLLRAAHIPAIAIRFATQTSNLPALYQTCFLVVEHLRQRAPSRKLDQLLLFFGSCKPFFAVY